MAEFLPALPHGELKEIADGIFFVTGTRQWHFMDLDWQFSRNMTVVRDGDEVVILNSVRLNEDGLAQIEALGKVTSVVQVGGLHGVDDPFYVDRYGATYWAQPGAGQAGMNVDRELVEGGPLPISDAELFVFHETKVPETVIRIDRAGGVLVACDAMQNYLAPDEFFSEQSAAVMQEMGFFTPCNVGPVWMQAAEPKAGDFKRLTALDYQHVLCGHGAPASENAKAQFDATFNRLFGV